MSTTPMVKITIDDRELEVPQGSMIIEAADNANMTIPRFCYHKKLSVAANCRMCLVEVANSRKPLPACATPVTDGMIVNTKSPKALGYQKAVMEFLLINHPLDCPICDQGGECELQDTAMGYGKDVSRYNQGKRAVEDKNIGPLIETDLTRCIQCTRCVRFGTEVAGMREMGMINRGEHSEIATFMEQAVDSELSGNVIDLCPVGALTNKPFRYQARPWELQQYPMIAPHDCIGSNLYVHVRRGEVMRAVPRENEKINEVWLSDRDRYSVHALNNANRATTPMLKKQGEWQNVSWEEALDFVADRLNVIRKMHGNNKIAALASPSNTVEEFYLLQKLMRGLGSHNMDFRADIQDFDYQYDTANFAGIDANIEEIANADFILIFGADFRSEVPILNHRIRTAALNGAQVVIFNPYELTLNFSNGTVHLCNFAEMTHVLAHLLQEVVKIKPLPSSFMEEIAVLHPELDAQTWTHLVTDFLNAKNPIILGGQGLLGAPELSQFMGLFNALREASSAKGGVVTTGANTAGAWLAGYIPHRGAAAKDLGAEGLHTGEILDTKTGIKGYLLINSEPGIDNLVPAKANAALQAADVVVAMSAFVTDYLKEYSDVILPIAAFTETAGSFVNAWGEWQSWQGAGAPKGEARPLWKVIRVLGNLFGLPGFDYGTHEDVLKELRAHLIHMKPMKPVIRIPKSLSKTQGIQRIGPLSIYATDMLTRQSLPLQETTVMQNAGFVGISPVHAQKLGAQENDTLIVIQGEQTLTLPCKIMNLAKESVFLPRGLADTAGFGEAFGPIEVRRA